MNLQQSTSPLQPGDATAASTRRFNAKREALVSAASALFNERGVVGTTVAEVAASVGLIKNSVTYYFRRKEDLAVACFERSIEVMDELVSQAATGATVVDRISALMRAQVAVQSEILAGRRPPIVAFHEIRALPSPHSEAIFASYTSTYRRLRRLLVGPETTHWPRAHLNARAHLLISYVFALGRLVGRYLPEDHARLAERMGDVVIHGLRGEGSAWTTEGAEVEWLSQMPERDLPALFLRAATELINEQGYGGASINRIAERLNLTKGGFYYYNENKGDLVEQCFERSFATIRKAISLTEGYGGSAWDHLCSIVRGLARFQISEDGPLLRSSANSALPDADHRTRVSGEYLRVSERIGGVITGGLIDGSLRPVDSMLASHLTLTGVMAAAEVKRWVKDVNEGTIADLYARPVVEGLLFDAHHV